MEDGAVRAWSVHLSKDCHFADVQLHIFVSSYLGSLKNGDVFLLDLQQVFEIELDEHALSLYDDIVFQHFIEGFVEKGLAPCLSRLSEVACAS
jgi:hypothetical protein